METEIVLVNESDELNPVLSYQWKCIKDRIKYESELSCLQNNTANKTIHMKEQEMDENKTIKISTNNTRDAPVSNLSSTSQNNNGIANTDNLYQETIQPNDNDDDDFF